MISKEKMRQVLLFCGFWNIGGGLMFLFPGTLGALAGLPSPAPFVLTWFVGMNILIFGFVSFWLRQRNMVDWPLLALFGFFKIVFFILMSIGISIGEVGIGGWLASVVDLVMGVIFIAYARQVAQART